MKKLLAVLCITAFAFTSCSKDDDNNSTTTVTTANVSSTVTSGTWRITLFNNAGTDKTSTFSGYNFTYASSGNLSGANSLLSVNGTWSTVLDGSKVKLIMNFPSPSIPDFVMLNEDWQVTARTDTKVTMQHISSGGGSTDYLTIEKN
jgi:hypothetical protein